MELVSPVPPGFLLEDLAPLALPTIPALYHPQLCGSLEGKGICKELVEFETISDLVK